MTKSYHNSPNLEFKNDIKPKVLVNFNGKYINSKDKVYLLGTKNYDSPYNPSPYIITSNIISTGSGLYIDISTKTGFLTIVYISIRF